MYYGKKEIVARYYGKHQVSSVYKGKKLIWSVVSSCFGNGVWNNKQPYKNQDVWKNN